MNCYDASNECQPDLPLCFRHDKFEGVLAFNILLFMKHLIKHEKMFSIEFVNSTIFSFDYGNSKGK